MLHDALHHSQQVIGAKAHISLHLPSFFYSTSTCEEERVTVRDIERIKRKDEEDSQIMGKKIEAILTIM